MPKRNTIPTTETVNIVYDGSFYELEMPLEKLVEKLKGYLDSMPKGDRHTAQFEHESGYYDDSDTYHIHYKRTRSPQEIAELEAKQAKRELEMEENKKTQEAKLRSQEMATLRRLEKKYRNKS